MDEDKWFLGTKFARDLDFTDDQYKEALKMIKSPDKFDANQLLMALIDVSSRSDTCCNTKISQQADSEAALTRKLSNSIQDGESSCYSSISSFPSSSSNRSFDSLQQQSSLRTIYIDGANVARTHSRDGSFSWAGIKLCVDWFHDRQHRVKVFVPEDRCNKAEKTILNYLINLDVLHQTPTGSNDDFFIIKAASYNNGVIVSNDLYRNEKMRLNELEPIIQNNRLPYMFVDDTFIPDPNPRGRSLDEFLSNSPENRKLGRTKSNSRNQRNGSVKQTNPHIAPRSKLRPTRSLPMEQTDDSLIDLHGQRHYRPNNHLYNKH